jgi:hypothetical protein
MTRTSNYTPLRFGESTPERFVVAFLGVDWEGFSRRVRLGEGFVLLTSRECSVPYRRRLADGGVEKAGLR